jgi:hypothetical protein
MADDKWKSGVENLSEQEIKDLISSQAKNKKTKAKSQDKSGSYGQIPTLSIEKDVSIALKEFSESMPSSEKTNTLKTEDAKAIEIAEKMLQEYGSEITDTALKEWEDEAAKDNAQSKTSSPESAAQNSIMPEAQYGSLALNDTPKTPFPNINRDNQAGMQAKKDEDELAKENPKDKASSRQDGKNVSDVLNKATKAFQAELEKNRIDGPQDVTFVEVKTKEEDKLARDTQSQDKKESNKLPKIESFFRKFINLFKRENQLPKTTNNATPPSKTETNTDKFVKEYDFEKTFPQAEPTPTLSSTVPVLTIEKSADKPNKHNHDRDESDKHRRKHSHSRNSQKPTKGDPSLNAKRTPPAERKGLARGSGLKALLRIRSNPNAGKSGHTR